MKDMHHEINKNGQLNIEINVVATKTEIARLNDYIIKKIGPDNVAPIVQLQGNESKGNRYIVKFALCGPIYFNLDTIRDWLHSLGLVGWDIEARESPKEEK